MPDDTMDVWNQQLDLNIKAKQTETEYLIAFTSKSRKKKISGTTWLTMDHQPHVFQIDRFTYMSSLCSVIHILEFRAKDFFLTDGADM